MRVSLPASYPAGSRGNLLLPLPNPRGGLARDRPGGLFRGPARIRARLVAAPRPRSSRMDSQRRRRGGSLASPPVALDRAACGASERALPQRGAPGLGRCCRGSSDKASAHRIRLRAGRGTGSPGSPRGNASARPTDWPAGRPGRHSRSRPQAGWPVSCYSTITRSRPRASRRRPGRSRSEARRSRWTAERRSSGEGTRGPRRRR